MYAPGKQGQSLSDSEGSEGVYLLTPPHDVDIDKEGGIDPYGSSVTIGKAIEGNEIYIVSMDSKYERGKWEQHR